MYVNCILSARRKPIAKSMEQKCKVQGKGWEGGMPSSINKFKCGEKKEILQ